MARGPSPPPPLSGESLLDKIRVDALFKAPRLRSLFESPTLGSLSEALVAGYAGSFESRFPEWRDYRRAVRTVGGEVQVGPTASEVEGFQQTLSLLERAYHLRSLARRDEALVDLVELGQRLLRRSYLAMMEHPGARVALTAEAELYVDTGAAAIQIYGSARRGPEHPYRSFTSKDGPHPDTLGIEILSSGAFPDWSDETLRRLRASGAVERFGFENVVAAVADSPRARVAMRALREGRPVDPMAFPRFLRTMLDLELMRLGQATTPGNYTMLLNSYYRGAGFVDHSTNVSEQVQVIYEEESWKPVYTLDPKQAPGKRVGTARQRLVDAYFRSARDSVVRRDHPRVARVEFTGEAGAEAVVTFFRGLRRAMASSPRVHEILPVLRLSDRADASAETLAGVQWIRRAGFRKLGLMAERVRHIPGVAQYFDGVPAANAVIRAARRRGVSLVDGRTVDMVATANKAIEATAGAFQSGQGCIKVGLLGLTSEQMVDFIRRVKHGVGARLKRQENQQLVFIGIVDEPLVTESGVLIHDAHAISRAFVHLMRRTRHNYLLIDTMRKGADDPRLLAEGGGDRKGHLAFRQLAGLVRQARKVRCDLWVAGSYTEEQVYLTAKAPAADRPGLICLGGAERSVGGLRLDPRDAYQPAARAAAERRLAALVEIDADVKLLLSRDNKLARDAGQVVGELARGTAGQRAEARRLEALRSSYLRARTAFFDDLGKTAHAHRLPTRNVDRLLLEGDRLFARARRAERDRLRRARARFEKARERYVAAVADDLWTLFADAWFPA